MVGVSLTSSETMGSQGVEMIAATSVTRAVGTTSGSSGLSVTDCDVWLGTSVSIPELLSNPPAWSSRNRVVSGTGLGGTKRGGVEDCLDRDSSVGASVWG